jgi:hypothetical protein
MAVMVFRFVYKLFGKANLFIMCRRFNTPVIYRFDIQIK